MPDSVAMTPAMIAPNPINTSTDDTLSAMSGMDSEGFMNLLVAQLKYQSPLEPKDPGDLMTQTAVLAQLDATQQLLAVQQRELGLSQAVAAAGMLGTQVTGTGADGTSVTGVVESVRYTEAGPVLDLGGSELLFAEVKTLRAGAAPATDATDL